MSSRTLNRKQFLVFTASAVGASVLAACGEDDPGTTGGGSGSGGTAGSGTAGSGTAGSAAGSTSGGSSSGASAGGSGGSAAGSGGSAAGSGGSGGAGGASGGSGGAGGASGGSGGSGGAGGTAGGMMCGTVSSIMHTSNNQHTHIPQDQAMLKMNLKTFINSAVGDTTEFTVPMGGQDNHVHKFKLTAQQITTLKGGGMVTGVETAEDDTNHEHTYTITCMA